MVWEKRGGEDSCVAGGDLTNRKEQAIEERWEQEKGQK